VLIANNHKRRCHYTSQKNANVYPYSYAEENERVIESPAISYSIILLPAYDPQGHPPMSSYRIPPYLCNRQGVSTTRIRPTNSPSTSFSERGNQYPARGSTRWAQPAAPTRIPAIDADYCRRPGNPRQSQDGKSTREFHFVFL